MDISNLRSIFDDFSDDTDNLEENYDFASNYLVEDSRKKKKKKSGKNKIKRNEPSLLPTENANLILRDINFKLAFYLKGIISSGRFFVNDDYVKVLGDADDLSIASLIISNDYTIVEDLDVLEDVKLDGVYIIKSYDPQVPLLITPTHSYIGKHLNLINYIDAFSDALVDDIKNELPEVLFQLDYGKKFVKKVMRGLCLVLSEEAQKEILKDDDNEVVVNTEDFVIVKTEEKEYILIFRNLLPV